MEKAQAITHFSIWVTCPHCDEDQDRREDLAECLSGQGFSAENINVELVCNNKIHCGETFIVESIEY